jgi:hypothetical protein
MPQAQAWNTPLEIYSAVSSLFLGQDTSIRAPVSGGGRFDTRNEAPDRSSSVLAMKKPRPMPVSWLGPRGRLVT